RAAVFHKGKFTLKNLPDPSPGPGMMLVKPLVCGICGSDLHTRHHAHDLANLLHRAGFNDFMDPDKPVVMGHEFCCEVIEYGPETKKRVPVGERVVGLPFAVGAGGIELLGYSNNMNGAFAEAMLLDENVVFQVPDHVPTDVAALAEPLSVAIHAVASSPAGPDCAFAVYGCGPVGLFVIARLRHLGLGPIMAIDPDENRRRFAEKMGADHVVAPSADETKRWWEKQGSPIGMSDASAARMRGKNGKRPIIFECVGKPGLVRSISEDAPVGAFIVVVGVCMEADAFEPAIMVQKELTARFIYAYNADEFAESTKMINAAPERLAALVTGEASLENVADAFDTLERGGSQAKVLVRI
ncbi:MAG: zinc-binding dehydrogenase, partial [Parvularculaceae bacterium]|nr:zinc-binding dehydrogenase [Parvularculaceae bacterium]